ncbi:MAG: alpha/beta fold hydrolase [Opitutaceae bacterium]|nr:alpha/beta fold hydrolase [Opitutaceae bacterium]
MMDAIRNARGERLDFSFHPAAAGTTQIVVIGHGVTGQKDRPFLIALADGLAQAGIATLRVSFSGNGGSDGRFIDSNITKEVADLGSVLDALAGFDVAYAGHSMGAAVGVLRASEDQRIRSLISLAGMVHVQAFAQRHFGGLTPDRDRMWDKPGCVLSTAYLEDLRRIDTVVDRAGRISVPWLFVHGNADTVVPLQDAQDAFARAREPKELVVLEGCDHIWEPAFTPRMVAEVVRWLRR